ncbi:hypothetical protein V8F20_006625 [Naviculisporaceae sp. PSN 640]
MTTISNPTPPVPQHSADSDPVYTYSVGFHLASSYGAAAVTISSSDDILETHTFTTPGSETYKDTMARLSLHSSEHLAPPYDSMQDYFDDIPRVLARRALKKAGLPASEDVGSLSTVIISLRDQIHSALNISITDAVITSPHLHALYQDDLYDIAQYAGIQYKRPKMLYQAILWQTGAACAGYNLNLCKNYSNNTACYDEIRQFPDLNILEVHYSTTALTSTLADMLIPTNAYEPDNRRVEDFTLGSEARGNYKGGEEQYWADVKTAITKRMIQYPTMRKPNLVILTGDDSVHDEKFRAVLKDGLREIMDRHSELPKILDDDVMVIAAKGAAELRRRGAEAPREN